MRLNESLKEAYGYSPRIITFYTEDEEIKIRYNYMNHVEYNGEFYDVPLTEEFFDVTRDLELKYFGNKAETWQKHWEYMNRWNKNDSEYYAFGSIYDSSIIVSPKHTFKEVLRKLKIDDKLGDETIIEVIESYDDNPQLYEIISFRKYDIKIIEMVDDKVEAVVFIYKNNK